MTFPDHDRSALPVLTSEQMIEVDRAMIEDFGIELIQMMENAGRALALVARQNFMHDSPGGRRVVILAGAGGNGGGALVAARRLATWGSAVEVVLTKPAQAYTGIPAHQLAILQAMDVSISYTPSGDGIADVVLDGIIGYSLRGAPRGKAADLIRWANNQNAPIVSLDTPSGLDTATGTAHQPSITASATLTLALPKRGLRHAQVGALYLADISVPPTLYERAFDMSVGPIFAPSDILHLT